MDLKPTSKRLEGAYTSTISKIRAGYLPDENEKP